MLSSWSGLSRVRGSNVKINISVHDSSDRLVHASVDLLAVRDWKNSPFSRYSLPFLLGRDFLANTNLSIQISGSQNDLSATVKNWEGLEIEVAAIYRSKGVSAKRDYNLAGHQIDVFLTEQTKSGAEVSTLVECKDHKRPVGRRYVTELASVFEFARNAKLAEHAVLVSSSGFTQSAQHAADVAGIELLDIEELRATAPEPTESGTEFSEAADASHMSAQAHKIFVIMPFKDEFVDFYMLGVREVANEFGYVCERVDEIEFNGSIRQQIIMSLRTADIVVAELSEQNANVYYELGWADALEKPTILCTRDINSAPFDIRDLNHIVYGSVFELRDQLRQRIKSIVRIEPLPNQK
tara:strand:+ start:10464 stop:11522 length:1059 start_codon:yes stop_codon:yes gene_type:complete